ncbi:glucosidase II Gls2 [Schizosaccharomyces japonicus yFS275]|uniref:Glucosidase II subunit alpha n=1 Tax=Schizosaccharomyces japonicus (strain yFS275 / FY16936) TaxID=402676 RepID=B6K3T9_SCHJY|nr:glucosidase II Gls2 [Schizosaccharomyces japonicus yFS275]EEB08146.1 glucosidase II Gls2 [Schizosaccharomyces japonicus yFS275]
MKHSSLAGKLLQLVLWSFVLSIGSCVRHNDFKTSSQASFAKRNRGLADIQSEQSDSWNGLFEPLQHSLSYDNGVFRMDLVKTKDTDGTIVQELEERPVFPLQITILQDNTVRITMDEQKRLNGEAYYSNEALSTQRFSPEKHILSNESLQVDTKNLEVLHKFKNSWVIAFGENLKNKLTVYFSPLRFEFSRDDELQIVLNERGLLNMEQWRTHPDSTDDLKGQWEETFNGFRDSKPKGPESLGLDIQFVGYEHVYGVPEHASTLSLRETKGGDGAYTEPYRLYNVDIFEYEYDSPMSQYGAIPFMQAHKIGSDVGVFWLNAAETWIDVEKERNENNETLSTRTHWYSESGKLDVFIFMGPTATSIYDKFTKLTSRSQLPPLFSIGYHQCRWNYMSQEDLESVDSKFDEVDMPYDVIWLDIEYTDGRRFFTWNENFFPHPDSMAEKLNETSRKLVVLIDPHLKQDNNYFVYKDITENDFCVKDANGNNYVADCWPGKSVWPDFMNASVVEWWGRMYDADHFPYAAKNIHIWNDMNEPSIFTGPETSMIRDTIHAGGFEHRDIHNIYGHLVVKGTYDGLRVRDKNTQRPFILSRSFYAGTNSLAATWIGDTMGTWEHLRASLSTVLTNGIAGMAFCGADVGSFFGNPDAELFVRWYEMGIFYPFFRTHAHLDTKRREPWSYGEPYTSMLRELLRIRYRLLPVWYTAFFRNHESGLPILTPQFLAHPDDSYGFSIEDQFYLSDSGLLIRPVTRPGIEETSVYLADEERYYDYHEPHSIIQGKGKHNLAAPLGHVPIFLRGGHIIATRERIRRSAELTRYDPYTLTIAVPANSSEKAVGSLYVDDGVSFAYVNGDYALFKFEYVDGVLRIITEHMGTGNNFMTMVKFLKIERIVILGAQPHLLTVQLYDTEGFVAHSAQLPVEDGGIVKPMFHFV